MNASDPIDVLVTEEMAKRQIPGVAVTVLQNGTSVKSAGYGLANVETQSAATPETVFQLASLTKQFTASAVMLLVREGKLALEDYLSKFVSEIPEIWKPITVRQLLNHTSGIFSLTNQPDYFQPANLRRDFDPRELLKQVADRPLEFEPGSRFNYNNTGYTLLGLVIEQVSGKSYADFLSERIFTPLEMTQTRVNDFRAIHPHRAAGYSLDNGTLLNCDYVSPTHPWAAGALVSSVSDLAKWDAALRTEAILTDTDKHQMWTPTTLSDGSISTYGFGWEVSEIKGHRIVRHGGGIPGFSTFLLHLPDAGLSVIVLANLDSADAGRLAHKIAGTIIPDLTPEVAEPIADPLPERTSRLTTILTGLLVEGTANEEAFTPEFWSFLSPNRLKDGPKMLGGKTLGDLTLTGLQEANGQLHLTYRVPFGDTPTLVHFALTMEDKVAGIALSPE